MAVFILDILDTLGTLYSERQSPFPENGICDRVTQGQVLLPHICGNVPWAGILYGLVTSLTGRTKKTGCPFSHNFVFYTIKGQDCPEL